MTETIQPITTPRSRQLRRALVGYLPVVFFVVTSALTVVLWQSRHRIPLQPGEVEVVEYIISSPQAGVVSNWLVGEDRESSIYLPVTKNQLLAQLDDGPARRRLEQLRNELLEISSHSRARVTDLETRQSAMSVAVSLPTAEPDKDASDAPVSKAEESLIEQTDAWIAAAGFTDRLLQKVSLQDLTIHLRQLDAELRQMKLDKSSTDAEQTLVESDRLATLTKLEQLRAEILFGSDDSDWLAEADLSEQSAEERVSFETMRRRCLAVDSELVAIAEDVQRLDIVAPADGQIESAFVRPLQSVLLGEPIAKIVSDRGTHVVVYVAEGQVVRPFPGMDVTLYLPGNLSQPIAAEVESVGPKVESVPVRLRVNPRVEQWGRPIRISIPRKWTVPPGSKIMVSLNSSSTT